MKKKNGFTLVELLAVIVILAIILVIAVPQIMGTIENARKGAINSTAMLIAASAEREYLVRQTLGETHAAIAETEATKIKCDDVAGVDTSEAADATSKDDYATCSITFTTAGKASVTLTGAGKFEGYTCTNATRTAGNCTKPAASGATN